MKQLYVYEAGTPQSRASVARTHGLDRGWFVKELGDSVPESPLLEPSGINHAEQIGTRLSYLAYAGRLHAEHTPLWVSGERSSRQTGELALSAAGLAWQIRTSEALNERTYGTMGRRVLYKWTLGNSGIVEGPPDYPSEPELLEAGAEPRTGVLDRIRRAFHAIADELPDGAAAVVIGHTDSLGAMLNDMVNIDSPLIRPQVAIPRESLLTLEPGADFVVQYERQPISGGRDPS